MGRKNYRERKWVTEDSNSFQTEFYYLLLTTSEYKIKLFHKLGFPHKINQLYLFDVEPREEEYVKDYSTTLIRIESLITGASLTDICGYGTGLGLEGSGELLKKSKNRNRDIFGIEINLINQFCNEFDASFSSVDERDDDIVINWGYQDYPSEGAIYPL